MTSFVPRQVSYPDVVVHNDTTSPSAPELDSKEKKALLVISDTNPPANIKALSPFVFDKSVFNNRTIKDFATAEVIWINLNMKYASEWLELQDHTLVKQYCNVLVVSRGPTSKAKWIQSLHELSEQCGGQKLKVVKLSAVENLKHIVKEDLLQMMTVVNRIKKPESLLLKVAKFLKKLLFD